MEQWNNLGLIWFWITHNRMNSDTTLPYEVTVLEKSIYEESNAK